MKTNAWISLLAVTTAIALLSPLTARAALITQWNFNSDPADAGAGHFETGSITPSSGSGSASRVGGTTEIFESGGVNGGSTDPATSDDTAWRISTFPAQGTANRTAGVRFDLSTVGFENIVVSLDQYQSLGSSRYTRFQYTVDGVNFVEFDVLAADSGALWYGRAIDLSAIAEVGNNANFGFQLVSEWESTATGAGGANYDATGTSYSGSGIWSLDMVTVSGSAVTPVPEPRFYALICALGLIAIYGSRAWLDSHRARSRFAVSASTQRGQSLWRSRVGQREFPERKTRVLNP